jgi:flagellar biosynthesis protein FlhG
MEMYMADQAENLREIMKNTNTNTRAHTHLDEVSANRASRVQVLEKPSKTRIITVASGKGGVGKTNIAVNLAIGFGKLGKRVVLMDADLGLANVNVVMGIIPKFNLYHLIRKQKTMKDIIMETPYGIRIVAGASGFAKIANLSTEERDTFVHELAELASADVIIIDTSAGVSGNVLSFVAAADEVIIVTTPEPTAITDAYGIIKIVATEIDNISLSLKLVVNRVKSVTEGKKVSERVINIAGQFLNLKVDYLGYVYDDPVVQHSVLKQKPFMATDAKSKASICVQHIVNRLERIENKEGGGLGSFLKKLFGREGEM